MAKFKVPYHCPLKFDLERFAMNGMVPNPSALRRLADGFNHVVCMQKRQVFAYSQNWNDTELGSGSIQTLWPVAFRTSRGTTGLIVRMGLVKSDSFALGAGPLVQLEVQPLAGGATVASATIDFNQRGSSAAVVPDDVNHQAALITGLDPATEYKMLIRAVDGARPIYCSIWERIAAGISTVSGAGLTNLIVDDGDDDICNPASFEAEGDLLDAPIQKLVTASNALLKQSRRHLLALAGTPYDQSVTQGFSITGSTSYVREVERTFHIDTSLLATLRRSGATAVPVRLAVCSNRISGTGTLDVALYDIDAAAVVAEVTGIGDDGINNWTVASDSIPAQDGRYEIHAKQSDASTTHLLYGVSMWPHEA